MYVFIYEFESIIIKKSVLFLDLVLSYNLCSGSLSCRLKHEIGLRPLLERHGEDISTKLRRIIF